MNNNRLGITILAAALAVIAFLMFMLLHRQQASHERQIRVQGLGVMRSLTTLPLAVLAPVDGRSSVLNSLLIYHDNPDFAYAAVTTPTGAVVAEVASAGVLVSSVPIPAGATSLSGERTLAGQADGRAVREFYGPLIEQEVLKGYVRVAFFAPQSALAPGDLPFYASLALLVFLLVPLAIYLLRREMAPLRKISGQLDGMALSSSARTHDVRALVASLQAYLDAANARVVALEQDNVNAVAHGRLLEYGSSKMSSVLQCMPDGLMMLDMSGEITFASSKIEPLLGVKIEDVLSGTTASWCVDPPLQALLARYRGDGADVARQGAIEFDPVRVPGKRLCVSAQALVGGHGAIAFGTLIVVRDCTREYLTRQAGNDFVAHVSHELKSPLNVIGMYAEVLQDGEAGSKELHIEAINVIQDEVERMNSLVNNLLNVSKLETGSMSPERNRVRLDDLLRDAYDQALTRAQSKALRMELSLPRELAAVSIDKDLFRIALNNLLTNAIKYNVDGGSVLLSAVEGEHEVVITVRDTGIGIAAAEQAQVFAKFYRASDGEASARGGHGLGLYLAGQIIELHHGRITLDSTPGQGSSFSIHLKKMPALLDGMATL